MTDVLFTHSYFLKFDPKEEEAMMPYPPLGTLYAASLAREQGYDVQLCDSMLADSEAMILDAICRLRPRVVVIYDDDFNYLTKMCLTRMREAAFAISAMAKREGCIVIVHGSDPVDHLGNYLDHGADFVLCGEGEHTLIDLLAYLLRDSGALEEIPGIAFRGEGVIKRNPERRVERDLDRFPFPARDLIDVDRYRALWMRHHGYFSTNIVTTRGCPFHCNWCAKPIYGQVYNSRTPANVVSEMLELRSTLNPDHLWFCDDIFGLKPGWVMEFAAEIRKQDAMIPFKCLARADLLVKDDMVEHLRAAGCTTVWMGAESGSQKILDAMDKGTTVDQIYESASLLKRAGIHVGFFLQYGYPGETIDDIEKTLAMVRDCQPDEIGVSVSYPLPGTPFYERVKEEMSEKQNWLDSQDLAMMFSGTYPPDFYRLLHRVTHKKFRAWKGARMLRAVVTRPARLDRRSMRTLASGLFHSATLPLYQYRLSAFLRHHDPAAAG